MRSINAIRFFLILIPFNIFSQPPEDNRNHVFRKFSSAKKEVFRISVDHKTFYCGCPFNEKKKVDLKQCGYQFRKSKNRASHVEVEHVVPADTLCGRTPEWKSGSPECIDKKGKIFKGRKCATEHNEACIRAYNDLHNLRPAIGEINSDRSNYPFANLPRKSRGYGACDFRIQDQKADPPDHVQGDIARIYLHMDQSYPELEILTEKERKFFMEWSEADPVTSQECRLEENIFRIQKTRNHFIRKECSLD